MLKNKDQKKTVEKSISLSPLAFQEAVSGLLMVDPKGIKKPAAKKRKKLRKTRG
jgi:hypothetical protein